MSRVDVADYLRLQGVYCGKLGSPLYDTPPAAASSAARDSNAS